MPDEMQAGRRPVRLSASIRVISGEWFVVLNPKPIFPSLRRDKSQDQQSDP